MSRAITATCTTIPERVDALRDVVEALLPQVDRLQVYLDGHDAVPGFLRAPQIEPILGREALGSLYDNAKFYLCEAIEGYHFTVDDDLLYPADYVERTIDAIERHGGEAVVSWHGKRVEGPVSSYAHDRKNLVRFPFWCRQADDEPITVPGTGVMAYRTDRVRFGLGDFDAAITADLHVARACARRGYPLICPARQAQWIRKNKKVDHPNRSVWAEVREDDEAETRIVNKLGRAVLDGRLTAL